MTLNASPGEALTTQLAGSNVGSGVGVGVMVGMGVTRPDDDTQFCGLVATV
jgi:hypothetical protein